MTTSTTHSRDSSKDSAASGASYQLILEHVFQKSGTYEIPLRTMYAINCSPSSHRGEKNGTSPSTAAGSLPTDTPQQPPVSPATAQFTSALIDHITKLPTQPCSLPPVFITTFLRRCFCEDLTLVDFPQALTGLDYLKDLETRRRRAIGAAFTKLGLQRDPIDADQIKAQSPSVVAWVKSINDSERKVEALYTQLYIGLRRWVMNTIMVGKKSTNVYSDIDQRTSTLSVQQVQLPSNAQHSIHPYIRGSTNRQPHATSHAQSKRWILQIYSGSGAKWDRGSERLNAARKTLRRRKRMARCP